MDWPKVLHLNRIASVVRALRAPPIEPDAMDVELLKKRHEECSRNLRNSVLTFAGFAAICWAALSKQDIDLLSVQSVVNIGVVGIEVTLDNFLTVAPLTALVLLIHSAVFRLRLDRLDPVVVEVARISTLFNLPGWLARLATFFLHVLIPVALLVLLLVKTSNREGFQWNLAVIAVALVVVVAANLRVGRFNGVTLTIALCIAAGLFAAASYPPLEKVLREQVLCRARLDYREVNFRDRGIDLRGGRFHCADFTRANLFRANLTDADFDGASLSHANLTGATLMNATLMNANLTEASFMRAALTGADLTGANLTDVSNLTQEQLDSACIIEGGKPPALSDGLKPPHKVCGP